MSGETAYAASYDELSYDSRAIPQAHIDRLFVLARLHEVPAAPIERCRVLEVGAADGAHLLPMAEAFPESQFVGIDVAAPQVARGQQRIAALGISNLELRVIDLAELPKSLGSFDYVIAHGVYSWVPLGIRQALLRLISERLTESGLGYVSYKTYPGCLVVDGVRQILQAALQGVSEPRELARAARTLSHAWQAALEPRTPMTQALKEEFSKLMRRSDSAIVHDWLGRVSEPVYFRDFFEQLQSYRLSYVCEAIPGEDSPARLAPPARKWLESLAPDPEVQQQALDVLFGRRIRHSLIRRGTLPRLQSRSTELVSTLHVACAGAGELNGGNLRLETKGNAVVTLAEPVASPLFRVVRAFPAFVSVADLVSERSHGASPDRARILLDALETLYRAGIVELRQQAPRCIREPGRRPLATALARLEAKTGAWVTNQHHQPVHMADETARRLLALCDGTRGLAALQAELASSGVSSDACEPALRQLAEFALLVE